MAVETAEIAVEKDVVFARGGQRELLCDVYRPPASVTKRTAIVHLHGGGFARGAKEGARTARPLAALGYTCIASQYRLASEATWPAQIEDAKAAIRWAREHAADLDFDSDKLVVLGYSAGGRLALIAAGSPDVGSEVSACVAFYAYSADASRRADPYPILGPQATDEAYRTFNPASYLTAEFPPTILLHGTADRTIAPEQALSLFRSLTDLGVPVELHMVEGVTHIFDLHADLAEASARWIDLFLDRHVVNPRRYASTEPIPPPILG